MLTKQNRIYNSIHVISFILIWIFYYAELLQGGIATHDELQTIAQYVEGTNKLVLGARWGMGLFHYPISLLQASMPNYMLYRMWTILGLIIVCSSVMIIIYRHIDQKLCWIFPIIFVLLAQADFNHNGLMAFGWGYQLDVAFVFISIEFFITYKKTGRQKYKILSAIAYLIAIMAYEAFAAFGVMLFLMDYLCMKIKKNVRFQELVKDLWIHFLFVLSYTGSFIVLSQFLETGDAAIGTETSIIGFIQTLKSYSIGLFPLRYKAYSFKQLFEFALDISWKNFALWIIILFFTKLIIDYLQKCKEICPKRYIIYSVICLLGVILPNVVISLTSKFQNWTLSGVKTFGTSYYSYYFLIFWIMVTIAFVFHKIKYKKCFIGIIFIGIALTARFTLISNSYYLGELHKNQDRYEAFMNIIESEYFKQLPENAQIYTNDYVGIHLNIDTLSNLATSVSEKPVRILNDKSQLDWNFPIYYLVYDINIKGVYLFEMTNDRTANEVYIQSKESLSNYYCMFSLQSDKAFPVYVDDVLVGAYRMNVLIPNLYTDFNKALIQNEKINIESFEVKSGFSKLDSSIISFDGIYGLEDWGRWSQGTYDINIDNVNNEEYCELTMVLAAGVHEDTSLNVEYNGNHEKYAIPPDGTELHLSIPLKPGMNHIHFNSEAEDLDVPTDPRNLNMQISGLNIIYDGNEYKYCR